MWSVEFNKPFYYQIDAAGCFIECAGITWEAPPALPPRWRCCWSAEYANFWYYMVDEKGNSVGDATWEQPEDNRT